MTEATLVLSWQAVSAIMGVLLIIVGGSTAYLKLFTQNQLAALEKAIKKEIQLEFQNKETSRLKEQEFEGRISRLEGKVFNGLK